jgi:hypothetical protein
MPPPRTSQPRPPTGRPRRGNLAHPRDLLVPAPSHAHPPLARIWRRAVGSFMGLAHLLNKLYSV